MSCLKFKSAKLNVYRYLLDRELIKQDPSRNLEEMSANEDIYNYELYPKDTEITFKAVTLDLVNGKRINKITQANNKFRNIANEYYGLNLTEDQDFLEYVDDKVRPQYLRFNTELLDQVDAARKSRGLYDDKLLADQIAEDTAEEEVDYYRIDDVDFLTDMFPSVEEQENIQAQEIATTMANRLAAQTGLSYEIVTPEEAAKITQDTSNPWNGEPAFYYNDQVYFVSNGFKLNHVLHEYAHPIVKAIYTSNQTLFNNLYKTILNTPEGAEIYETVQRLYPEFDVNDTAFAQEVFVRALEKASVDKVSKQVQSAGFKKFITNLLYGIKQLLRKIFGKGVRVDKLSVDTTLDQLADMLVGDNFLLTTEIIQKDDIVSYMRGNQTLYKDLDAVNDNVLNDVVNRYFTNATSILSRVRNNKNYDDFVKAVTTETGRSIIQDIVATLRPGESLSVDDKVKKFQDDLDKRQKQVQSFVRSMIQTDILADKVLEKLAEMSALSDTQTVINKAFYYDLLLRNWAKFVDESIDKLTDAGLRPDSALSQKLANLKNKIDQSNRIINRIYKKGVGGVLFDVVNDLSQNVNQYFETKIADLEAKKAPQKEIQKTKLEFERLKLSREVIDDYLSGMRGDVNPLSAYVEAFSSSPDIVISSFSVFMDNAYTEVDTKATTQTKLFFSELKPALKAAGYSDKNVTSLMSQLVFKDKIFIRGKDGKVEEFEKLVMLNPWKGHEAEVDRLEFAIQDAKRNGNIEEARMLNQELRQLSRDYFHDQYKPEFYEKEKVYDSALGRIAYERKTNLLAEIADIDARVFDDLTEDEAFKLKKDLWRQYQQLASEYNVDGTKKLGDELEISKIEKQYRDESRKFYEWKEITGLFQYKFDQHKQDLLDQGLKPGSREYNAAQYAWLQENTRVSITPEFYEAKGEILDKLKQITARLKDEDQDLDISDIYTEMIEVVKGYRDESNQPIGNEIPEARVAKIKKLQEQIESSRGKLAGYSGLTKQEFENYIALKVRSKTNGLTAEESAELDKLITKKANKELSAIEIEIIKTLYAQLADLQTKEPTQYYYDTINDILSRSVLPKSLADKIYPNPNDPVVTTTNLESFMDDEVLQQLFEISPEFKTWFENNHVAKYKYSFETKMQERYYERLYIWNTIRPSSPKYYESYEYFDTDPVTGDSVKKTINRIPTLDFYRRAVKSEYRTQREVGKTVDNRGNWLPRSVAEGAKDDRFVNKAYFDLRKNEPAKAKVLDIIVKNSLEFQKDKTRGSRLYLDVPRMAKLSSEIVAGARQGFGSKTKALISQIKSQFADREDNFEMGLNYDTTLNLVRADMFDEEISSIPVRGLYRLNANDVSLNIPYSLIEYMYSLEHQKKLIEINPIAQALQKVVNDPDNAVKDVSKINASNFVNNNVISFLNKKGKNLRAEAINSLIEIRFQGKTRTGILSEKSTVQKAIDVLQSQATFGMFAMNILPSAVKNFGGAFTQIMIEAGGGKYYNAASLTKAAPRAFKAMFDISSQIYKVGDKSIDYQLIEYFDPIKGRIEERLGSEFGRSVGTDAIDSVLMFGEGRKRTGGFWTAPRKWLQSEATLNSFYALMYHTKVPMTINGQTTYISYVDAWEKGPDGIIKLKQGIDESWGLDGANFKKIKNATQEISNNLEGAYSKVDKSQLDRYAIWRLFSALRRYFTRMFLNRFSPTRYSTRLGALTEGYYWTVAKSIPNLIARGLNGSYFMTQQEIYAYRKMMTDMGVIALQAAAIAYIFGYDPDDEERFEKLRERSGDLLSDDFNAAGWLTNHALVSLMGVRQETLTFLNPNEYVNIIYSNGSPTVGPILDRYKDFGKDAWYMLTNDKRGYYTRDVGPYDWQKEGEAKLWNDVAYLFGLSGSQVDPVKALKGIEYQTRR